VIKTESLPDSNALRYPRHLIINGYRKRATRGNAATPHKRPVGRAATELYRRGARLPGVFVPTEGVIVLPLGPPNGAGGVTGIVVEGGVWGSGRTTLESMLESTPISEVPTPPIPVVLRPREPVVLVPEGTPVVLAPRSVGEAGLIEPNPMLPRPGAVAPGVIRRLRKRGSAEFNPPGTAVRPGRVVPITSPVIPEFKVVDPVPTPCPMPVGLTPSEIPEGVVPIPIPVGAVPPAIPLGAAPALIGGVVVLDPIPEVVVVPPMRGVVVMGELAGAGADPIPEVLETARPPAAPALPVADCAFRC
jgi:hypothetical protein